MKHQKILEDFYNQKFNKDYLLIITASNSTFRAFRRGSAYTNRNVGPSIIFKTWMSRELDQLNKRKNKEFSKIYAQSFKSLDKFWFKASGKNLNSGRKKYLLYKLLDLFFKHALLYGQLDPKVKKEIFKNTMPPIDSLVLKALVNKDGILYAKGKIDILDAIPKTNPSMGNVPRKKSIYASDYVEFRKDCHKFFSEWAKRNKTFPICYDLHAWHKGSSGLKLLLK